MAKDLFQFLSNAFEKREPETPSSCDKGEFYMVTKYLSLYPETFAIAVKANRLMAKLPAWATGCYLYHTVRRQTPAPFIKYPKKEKAAIEEKNRSALIKKVGIYFCCSPIHAEQILGILEKHDNVYHLFGMDGKKH